MRVVPRSMVGVLLVAACAGERSVAPVEYLTMEQLPAAEVADLRQQEAAEVARIEARRVASGDAFDSLSVLWSSLQPMSWGTTGALLACLPRAYDGEVKIVGPEGGTLSAGITTLYIPPGALDRPTVVTMETPAAIALVSEFRPHGLHFRRRASITFGYEHCRRPTWLRERVAYVGDDGAVLEWPESLDRSDADEVEALIGHFSRYAVAF
jgi:hypothetical protein